MVHFNSFPGFMSMIVWRLQYLVPLRRPRIRARVTSIPVSDSRIPSSTCMTCICPRTRLAPATPAPTSTILSRTHSKEIPASRILGALTTVDKIFPLIFTPGEQIYEYETVRRYVNVRCVVTNIISLYVTFAVVLVPDHARYGSMGSDD